MTFQCGYSNYHFCNTLTTISTIQLIMTPPLPKLWKFGLSANNGYVYFMQRPDGRVLVGKWVLLYRIFYIFGNQ